MRNASRAGAAATVAAGLVLVLAQGIHALAAGQATGALSVRVVVVAPSCPAGDGCAGASAAIAAPDVAGSPDTAPVAVRDEREGDHIVRTVIY
jgi:hypothetical protein